VHIAVGLIFPALMVIHVLTGRRRVSAADKETST